MDPSAHALSDFNFDAVGDWGCNSNTQSTVKNIKGKNSERIFALNDYSYQPTAICWLKAIDSINQKSVTRFNIGNHENDANEGNIFGGMNFYLPCTQIIAINNKRCKYHINIRCKPKIISVHYPVRSI